MALLVPTLTAGIISLSGGLSGVALDWRNTPVGETTGYYIERKTNLTDWGHLDTVAHLVTTYTDSKFLSPGTLYHYRIRGLPSPMFGFSSPISISFPSRIRNNFTFCDTGKYELLIDYFTLRTSDLYIGLWQSSLLFGLPNTDFISMSDFSSTYELSSSSFSGYQRIRIPKNDSIVDSLENKMYLRSPISFRTLTTWNNIGGFFISTTSDNTGKLIYLDRFKTEGTALDLEPGKYLNIFPKIGLF